MIVIKSSVSSNMTLNKYSESKGLCAIFLECSPSIVFSEFMITSVICALVILRPCLDSMRNLFSACVQKIIFLDINIPRIVTGSIAYAEVSVKKFKASSPATVNLECVSRKCKFRSSGYGT